MIKQYYTRIHNQISSFIIVKKDTILHEDIDIGVKPIMKIIHSNPTLLQDNIIIDKVIGKAAAILLVKYKAKEVHGLLMSESAMQVLKKHNIPYYYEASVPFIKNRSNDGLCPLEDSVYKCDDIEQGYENIKKRIEQLMNNTYKP